MSKYAVYKQYLKFDEKTQKPSVIAVTRKDEKNKHMYEVHGIKELEGIQMPSATAIAGLVDGTVTTPYTRGAAKRTAEWATKHRFDKSISDEEFTKQAKDAPARYLKQAGERGTRIHNALEMFLREDINWVNLIEPEEMDNLLTCFEKVKKFIKDEGAVIVGTELPVFHIGLEVAGTIDLLLMKDSYCSGDGSDDCFPCAEDEIRQHLNLNLWIVDFKTGSQVGWKDRLQVSTYINCIEDMVNNGIEIWDGMWTTYMTHKVEVNPLNEKEVSYYQSVGSIAHCGAILHIQEKFGKKETPRVVKILLPSPLSYNVYLGAARMLTAGESLKTSREIL